MMTQTTLLDRPRSRSVSTVPGIVIRRLIAPVTDESGRVWPAGTDYTPLSGGATPDGYRVTVTIL